MDEIKGSVSNAMVITDESMLKVKTMLESAFTDKSKQQTEDLVVITCPHCGGDFNISHSAFKSQLKVQADDKAADE